MLHCDKSFKLYPTAYTKMNRIEKELAAIVA